MLSPWFEGQPPRCKPGGEAVASPVALLTDSRRMRTKWILQDLFVKREQWRCSA
jgi:hypothetical protein